MNAAIRVSECFSLAPGRNTHRAVRIALLAVVALGVSICQSRADWPLTPLYTFTNGSDGYVPQGGLTLAPDGFFYGTTLESGDGNGGTVYRLSTNGEFSVVYPFSGLADGGTPHAGLTLASDGFLYGTTITGGTNNSGVIFRVSTNNSFEVVHTFSNAGTNDGYAPNAPLVQATDGWLYGTTAQGGVNSVGNIFRVSPEGEITNLYSFSGEEGYEPMAPLFQASDGNFYGTAALGGSNNMGTIFKMTPAGVLTPLYAFSAAPNLTNLDGTQPLGGLVQGGDGALYGVTSGGGTFNGGTIYRITTNGAFSVIHSLDLNLEGADSSASLIVGSDGKMYGTTQYSGPAGNGSVFQVTTNGAVRLLYSFVGGNFGDGGSPSGTVAWGRDGYLYGATPGQVDYKLINPNPPGERPMLVLTNKPARGTVAVSGRTGWIFRIFASTDLSSWSAIGSVTVPDAGVADFVDTNASAFTYRFYRAVNP